MAIDFPVRVHKETKFDIVDASGRLVSSFVETEDALFFCRAANLRWMTLTSAAEETAYVNSNPETWEQEAGDNYGSSE